VEVAVVAGKAKVEAFGTGARTTAAELLVTWLCHSAIARVDAKRLTVVVAEEHCSCGRSGDVIAELVHSEATDLG